MTISIGQVSYALQPAVADPGQLADNEVNHIVGAPAIETINPGRLVQIASDGVSVQQVQGTRSDTTTAEAAYGVAVLLTAREGLGNQNAGTNQGGAYAPGDMVPVIRRGGIFGEWKGTTIPGNGTVNVYQSSTIATDRGKFTDAAAATTAGSEIGPVGNRINTRPPALPGTGNIVFLDVSFPGAV